MDSAATGSPAPALTGSVRARVITLSADALSRMPLPNIPPPLRRAASFAPAKRAKLVGAQLATAVDADDAFRSHLAVQVRALAPRLAALLDEGLEIDPAELVDAAAVAYLLRPDGWQALVASAGEGQRPPSAHDLADTSQRLGEALDQARGELKAVRAKLRSQLDGLKADNAQLRRTLGATRTQLKDAVAAADRADAAVTSLEQSTAQAAREAAAEARRLRARVEELESDRGAARRAARAEYGAEVVRLRLLLDTVVEAASGLRRELALPPSELLPADTVVAVEPASDSGAAGVGRALLQDDPALLRRLLELPRVHLIVDGYNVSKTAWPSLPLTEQRSRLANGLSAVSAGRGVETTVVFDGAELVHPPAVTSPRGVRVRFSPPGVIADDLIRELVEAEPVGRPVVVVSTDRELATSVAKRGARSVAALALVRAMGHLT